MMNDKEFEKAQASIMNKKAKLMKLRSDRAEACKKMSEIEQAIARTEKELLGEENDFIVLHMEESASSQPERIFPFHDSPFSILEYMLNNTNHF